MKLRHSTETLNKWKKEEGNVSSFVCLSYALVHAMYIMCKNKSGEIGVEQHFLIFYHENENALTMYIMETVKE